MKSALLIRFPCLQRPSQEINRTAGRWAVRVLIFFALYLFGGYLGTRLLFPPYQAIAFWPPSGLMLGALLVAGPGEWSLFVIAAIAATILFQAPLNHQSPLLSSALACGNFLEAAIGNWALKRLCRGVPCLERARDVLCLLFVSAGLALIGAASGLLFSGSFSEDIPIYRLLALWWSADFPSLLIFTPLVLAWALPAPPAASASGERATFAESALFFTILAIAAAFSFGGFPFFAVRMPYPSVAFPLLLWGAMRLPARTLERFLFNLRR